MDEDMFIFPFTQMWLSYLKDIDILENEYLQILYIILFSIMLIFCLPIDLGVTLMFLPALLFRK